MSRPLRIHYPGAVYYVMNRGRARQPTFVDDTEYQAFLDTLADAHRLWGIEVFAYTSGNFVNPDAWLKILIQGPGAGNV